MREIAILIAIVLPLTVTIFLALVLSGERWRVAQDKVRARRLADAKMNARLLRLNI